MATRWDERFFESTRGRLVLLLRRGARTVEELAQALELTDNGVRAHLATLERDRLARQTGVRRGQGKPAFLYELTDDAERLFPHVYGPVLHQLLDVLGEQLPPASRDSLLREVGRRLAAAYPVATGAPDARVAAAVALLHDLGGDVDVEPDPAHGRVLLRGFSCPLAAAVPGHPEMCRMAATLLGETTGLPVQEACEREGDGRPRCLFTLDTESLPAGGG
jgi:predicted ArsR family transcriptional regulator